MLAEADTDNQYPAAGLDEMSPQHRKQWWLLSDGIRGYSQAVSDEASIPVPIGVLGPLCCPLGKKAQLRLVDENQMLAECVFEESSRCLDALSFGGSFYCRALWKYNLEKSR